VTQPAPQTVLYVANATKIGGGNRVLMDLIRGLDPARYAPVLVCPEDGPLVHWAVEQGLSHFICQHGDWQSAAGLARRSVELLRIVLRTRAAVVHAAAPTCYRALGVAAYAARAVRVCHLGFPPERGEIERSFLSGPDAVVGCYEGQARDLAEQISRVTPRCQVRGIPNGVDTNRFMPGGIADLDDEGRKLRAGASAVVAILGHLSEVKGYPTFIEAAARIVQARPDTRFLAIGGETVGDGYRSTFEARVNALGLQDRVQFLGFRSDVPKVLRAVDVVTLPSTAEGFPLAVLEAMACGKPVIATTVGGVPEAVLEGVTGLLIQPGRPDELASAVLQLLGDPAGMARMGVEARARIERLFSARVFAQRVQALYDELLCSRS
jgi:glycosyltransferase involved in cell wall biosynthesis